MSDTAGISGLTAGMDGSARSRVPDAAE